MDEFVVLQPEAGSRFPLGFPLVFRDIAWRPFDQLPLIPRGKGTKRLLAEEQAYRNHLAGQGVRLIGQSVTSFLVREAS